MKDIYSNAIIDTIDMFEDIYGAGGNIPINTDLKEVTPETKNNKIIDRVAPEYLELLDYTQTIYPEREVRYEKHAQEQIKWENYFDDKYGKNEPENLQNIKNSYETKEIDEDKLSLDEINEKFKQKIRKECELLPSSLMRQYINFITNEADLTYKIKVAELTTTYNSLYDLEDKELSQTLDKLNDKFYNELEGEVMSVNCAMNDIATKYKHPSAKKIFIDFDSSDKEDKDASLSKLILEHKKEYDDLYSSYISPMTDREKNLTGLAIMNEIDKFKPDKNLPDNTNAILMMLRDEAKLYPVQRKTIRDFISGSIPDCYKSMLNKNLSKEDKYDRFSYLIPGLIDFGIIRNNYLQLLVNKEVVDKYKPLMDAQGLNYVQRMETSITPAEKEFYYTSNEDIKAGKMNKTVNIPNLQIERSKISNKKEK